MEFTFGDEYKDGPLALGLHKRDGFYDIVSVSNCRIADGDFMSILACTLEWAAQSGLPYYHRSSHKGYFRHLLVRKAAKTGEILAALVTASGGAETRCVEAEREAEILKQWTERLLALKLNGKISGILHTVNNSAADAVKDEGTAVLYGQAYFYEELLGLDRKSTRLNSSHIEESRMPSSA